MSPSGLKAAIAGVSILVSPILFAATDPLTHDPVLYKQGWLRIVSPDHVTTAEAKAAAAKIMAAWQFDLGVMQWTRPKDIEKPLSVRILSDQRMNVEHKDARAITFGGARFDIRLSLVGDPSFDLTIAHELGHVQSSRAMGRRSAPKYFVEGHGLLLNLLYAEKLGLDDHRVLASMAKTIKSFTAEEAQAMLTDDAYVQTGTEKEQATRYFRMERFGVYLIEYIRVRKSQPDAVTSMGRVFERAGAGRNYPKAFREVYGVSLDRIASDLCAFLKRTEADPAERLKGTRFE